MEEVKKTKGDVVDKFREFWKSLESREKRQLMDLLTMVRGPDMEGEYDTSVKDLTTVKIRSLLGIDEGFLMITRDDGEPLSADGLWKAERSSKSNHFRSHVGYAKDVLEELKRIT